MSSTSTPPEAPAPRRAALLVLSIAFFLVGAFFAWRRKHNPTLQWAQHAERAHDERIQQAVSRCFGTTDPVAMRAIAERTRRSELPAPLRDCRTGPAAELIVAPNSFMEALRDAPEQVSSLCNRARTNLTALSTSARQLEQALSSGGPTPNEAQRDAIAQRVTDIAHDIEQEQQSVHDVIAAARDAAGWL